MGYGRRVLLSFQPGLVIIHAEGTLDIAMVKDIQEQLAVIVGETPVRGVVLSCKRIPHVHFQSVGPLRSLATGLANQSIHFRLCDVSSYLQQILVYSGFPETHFDSDSIADAILHLGLGDAEKPPR